VRNDLAALERLGLLTHPHTSAGRVPTEAGYRYFVRFLLPKSELPSEERHEIRVQFGQARPEIDQWLRLSTSVLARTTQAAALATPPHSAQSRYKHLELVAIHGIKVLLVLVLQEGTVKQQMLDVEQPMEQDELSRISNELNEQLAGLGVTELLDMCGILSPFARQIAHLVAELMQRSNGGGSRIYRDGLGQILNGPDLSEGESIRGIVQVFEEQTLLQQVIDEFADLDGIHVVISGDGRFAELHDTSLVLSRYGVADHTSGLLGVIGPLRMSYGRTMGAVRFVAAVMSELVTDIYGLNNEQEFAKGK
jgi:heat-inducible transcriptional repressor